MYQLTIRYMDGREVVRFDVNNRQEMLDIASSALERWDVAYIHIAKYDAEGILTNQKMIEGAAFDTFLEEC